MNHVFLVETYPATSTLITFSSKKQDGLFFGSSFSAIIQRGKRSEGQPMGSKMRNDFAYLQHG